MVHGDDRGLVLPPKVAPIEAVILPIAAHKPGVLDKANEIAEQLKSAGIRVKDVTNMEELGEAVQDGFARAMWCGDDACELEVKARFNAKTRNMPFDQTPIGDTCVCCGKKATKLIYFGKQY